jgi:uncharacterized protein YeaO (DUF488 family)
LIEGTLSGEVAESSHGVRDQADLRGGVSKVRAQLDEWAKDIAPTPELRSWFGHDGVRFEEFTRRYRAELDVNPEVARFVKLGADHDTVTLLYGAHDPQINHAVVLRDYLESA